MPALTKDQFLRSLNAPEDDCGICYTPYDEEHRAVRLGCGHQFGYNCILSCVEHSLATCPMCRSPMFGASSVDDNTPIRAGQSVDLSLMEPMMDHSTIPGFEHYQRSSDYEEQSEVIRNLPEADMITIVQKLWLGLQSYACVDLGHIQNTISRSYSYSSEGRDAWENLLTGIMHHMIGLLQRSNIRIESLERWRAVVRYMEYATLHQCQFGISFRKEPVRALLNLLVDIQGLGFPHTLLPETAKLFWEVSLMNCRAIREPNVFTSEEKLKTFHFALVVNNTVLVALGGQDRAIDKVIPECIFFTSGLYLDIWRSTRLIQEQIRRVQDELSIEHRPYFEGKTEEMDHVRQIYDIWRQTTNITNPPTISTE
jgi:hypothetical protein